MAKLSLVDSHCHLDILDLQKYQGDLSLVLATASEQGVEYVLCPGVDLEHHSRVLDIAKQYPKVWAAVGVHPTEIDAREPEIEELVELASDPQILGIGETGLDYANCLDDVTEQQRQQRLFAKHIRAAKIVDKPLIIHSRLAAKAVLEILRAEAAQEIGGTLHCFVDDLATATFAMEMNFYISFSGIVTFKNAEQLRQVARAIPLDKVLLETDAPYLAPVPMRGKANEPAFLRHTAEYFAQLRGITLDELAKQTTENFFSLFKP